MFEGIAVRVTDVGELKVALHVDVQFVMPEGLLETDPIPLVFVTITESGYDCTVIGANVAVMLRAWVTGMIQTELDP